jgi:hypothetical protein
MFIDPAELKTVVYQYQIDEITENDSDIIVTAIMTAIEETKLYLRNTYDCDVIFAQTGAARNPLIAEYVKGIALWHIIRLSNVDMIYTQVKERYDRIIKALTAISAGELSPDLPHLTAPDGTIAMKLHIFSNRKFGHGN